MGLDMYLTGERYFHSRLDVKNPLVEEHYRLGYWRKHPNLHGYIVETFNDDDDDCEPITLSAKDIFQIIAAIKDERLPYTDGPFFGKTDGSEKEEDIAIFTHALTWLEESDEAAWRSITYQASW